MDERTEREKMLDRFLNGPHPAMTEEQLAAFMALGDRASIILLRGPYLYNVTTPDSPGWLLRSFIGTRHAGRDEWYSWMDKSKERNMDNKKGLYRKFDVRSARTGERIPSAFVMLPEKDPAAVVALRQYALNIEPENPVLSADILRWIGTIVEREKYTYPPILPWALDFFVKGMRTTTNGSGQDLVLIEAGPGRGKTTLGIIAGIDHWERHATSSTGIGFIVTNNSSAPGSGFLHAQHLADVLVNEFHAVVTCRHENIVSIPTKTGHRTIRICAIDNPVLEGSHMHADWLFVDNLDFMHPQTKVWRFADRLDPKMLIFSQSVHTFASAILANKNEWNVLTDPTLL